MAERVKVSEYLKTVYADSNTPNAPRDCVKKTLKEVKKLQKYFFIS